MKVQERRMSRKQPNKATPQRTSTLAATISPPAQASRSRGSHVAEETVKLVGLAEDHHQRQETPRNHQPDTDAERHEGVVM